mgnify:CR=1 FL=1
MSVAFLGTGNIAVTKTKQNKTKQNKKNTPQDSCFHGAYLLVEKDSQHISKRINN